MLPTHMNDELEDIPILENELMWIARVVSELSAKDSDDDESE